MMLGDRESARAALTIAAARLPIDAFVAAAAPQALRIAAELGEGVRLSLGAIGVLRGRR